MLSESVNRKVVFLVLGGIFLFHQVGFSFCERVASGKIGSQVTLPCDSSRSTELFMFWETPMGVIAPGYNTSRSKYKYDVLTGDLKIYIHQKEENGKYSCYSRNLYSGAISVSTVALEIEEQWQAAGSDFLAVLYRCIAIVSVTIVVLGGWIAHIFWKKFLQKSYILDGK
uniref:Junctional adhesion molecule A n=1 Tax=Lygus hesperus TaxID=30085 RepID=A0A0A9XH01_LYGHE